MKAFDLMALAAKEPQKYEGKRYRVTCGAYDGNGNAVTEFQIKDGAFIDRGYYVYVRVQTELEEIRQPIPFLDAVKAYAEGKTIEVEFDGRAYTLYPSFNRSSIGMGTYLRISLDNIGEKVNLSTGMVLDGKWYIHE